jgi:hypothetical protein
MQCEETKKITENNGKQRNNHKSAMRYTILQQTAHHRIAKGMATGGRNICVCMYMKMYTNACACTCAFVYVCVYMCVCMCVCVCVCVYGCMCVCVHLYIYGGK